MPIGDCCIITLTETKYDPFVLVSKVEELSEIVYVARILVNDGGLFSWKVADSCFWEKGGTLAGYQFGAVYSLVENTGILGLNRLILLIRRFLLHEN